MEGLHVERCRNLWLPGHVDDALEESKGASGAEEHGFTWAEGALRDKRAVLELLDDVLVIPVTRVHRDPGEGSRAEFHREVCLGGVHCGALLAAAPTNAEEADVEPGVEIPLAVGGVGSRRVGVDGDFQGGAVPGLGLGNELT